MRLPRGRNGRPFSVRRALRAAFLALLLFIAGGLIFVELSLNRTTVFDNLADRPGRSIATNWLLVGSDSRAGLTDEQAAELSTGAGDFGQRTDTIMIAHIPVVGKAKLVSIPRDSFVEIPGHGTDKINAAFSLGGPELLTDTVEKSTGVRIDHYAEIGFGGFAGIVDAAGGIEMCPPEAIQDPLAGLDIQAGCQKFDGKNALGYVRTRATAQGDLDRVGRQREFMGALMKRVSSPWVLLNPYRTIRLANAGVNSLTVSEKDHSWNLGWLMARLAMGTESLTVPTAGTMDTDYAGNVLLWDENQTEQFFKDLR
ncbi:MULTISPECIES: LCP family protein [unclassified Corynebacterium]|uniref:LCP family protein n=1 Tax=unclassified Corynebacterium TaxID=2624378 RepID=UPI0030960563